MEITAKEVNELRKKTGAGLMDCKKALVEANGDFDAAIDILRKQGQKISAQRADREALEGVVIAITTDDAKRGVIVNLSCETDFVAKNEEFIGFAQSVADAALENNIISKDDLMETKMNGLSLKEKLDEQIGRIGEKLEIPNYVTLEGESVVSYIHAGNRIGVLVSMNKEKDDSIETVGRDIAMQIAAMSPLAINKDSIEQSVIDKELEIAKEQVRAEGKPEELIEKIAEGKLNKFFKENTLMNQAFVKDGAKTVEQVLKEVDPDLVVVDFKRVALGK
ncbi:MAG: elongation factor Ts [Bacteroidetes bacterium]|nr:elongation factor Ts [Bacteroidota bacterium]